MKPEVIIKRFDAAESDRKILDNTFEVIERFVIPFRGEYFMHVMAYSTTGKHGDTIVPELTGMDAIDRYSEILK